LLSSDLEQSSVPENATATASVRCRALTKKFGKRTSVDALNLEIFPGELYALLGDNGAGKTTTISMLTTLLEPTSGDFFICGHNGRTEPEKIKGCFGVVSQDLAVYSELTPYENLKFLAELYSLSKSEGEKRIEKLLARAGLLDRLNDRIQSLSGGMMRRLSIACAMINEPKVLFMDEPTVGLDPASRRLIWESLHELKSAGVTIMLTTHYLEEAELLADRIGIIKEGKLDIEGTVTELAQRIRGMRGISIRLASGHSVNSAELKKSLDILQSKFTCDVRLDNLRNTVYISRPDQSSEEQYHKDVFAWLYQENIPFVQFATGEPNLEEVFLAVSRHEDNPAPSREEQ
jgi:ABC-2 type transport system ATP-binding protein